MRRWSLSVKTNSVSVKGFHLETKTPTFQFNCIVVSKLIWIELELNLRHTYFEK